MKSGTNWICNLLNLHPKIACVGEFHWQHLWLPFSENIARRAMLNNRGLVDPIRRRLERVIRETLVDVAEFESNIEVVTWIGDRTPQSIEPCFLSDAPHITVIRDGRDVTVSRAFHLLAKPEQSKLFAHDEIMANNLRLFQADPHHFAENRSELLKSESFVRQTAQLWKRIVESDLKTQESVPAEQCLVLHFEQVHRDVETERAKMYRFLGLDPAESRPLEDKTKPGFDKVDPNSLYRSGKVGEWKDYFSAESEAWFQDEAGELLRRLGY